MIVFFSFVKCSFFCFISIYDNLGRTVVTTKAVFMIVFLLENQTSLGWQYGFGTFGTRLAHVLAKAVDAIRMIVFALEKLDIVSLDFVAVCSQLFRAFVAAKALFLLVQINY